MEKKIKKGDIVCIMEPEHSGTNYRFHIETTVESSGNKYITTKFNGKSNKFDADTLYSEFMGYKLFKGNKSECEEYIKNSIESKGMIREIESFIHGSEDFDLIREIYSIIKTRVNFIK